jgi:hypothetical protein
MKPSLAPRFVLAAPSPLVDELRVGAWALVLALAIAIGRVNPQWVLPGAALSRVIRTPFAVYTAPLIVTEIAKRERSFRTRNNVRGVHGLCGDLCGAETRAVAHLCMVCGVLPYVTRARARACAHTRAGAQVRACNPAHRARPHNPRRACLSSVQGPVRGQRTPHRRLGERGGAVARARGGLPPSILKKNWRRLVGISAAQPAPHLWPASVFCAVHTPTMGGGAGRC